ncbi:MAG: hypothetical protein JWP63_3568, partial [Candidatus Solibacter sp.]|nr:hypothetical protein [Candidatus Solibacter sp.]
ETRNEKPFYKWTGMKADEYRVRWTFEAGVSGGAGDGDGVKEGNL